MIDFAVVAHLIVIIIDKAVCVFCSEASSSRRRMGLIGSEWMPTHFTDVKTLSVTANKIRGLCTWSILTKTRTKAKTKTTLLLSENTLSVFHLEAKM